MPQMLPPMMLPLKAGTQSCRRKAIGGGLPAADRV